MFACLILIWYLLNFLVNLSMGNSDVVGVLLELDDLQLIFVSFDILKAVSALELFKNLIGFKLFHFPFQFFQLLLLPLLSHRQLHWHGRVCLSRFIRIEGLVVIRFGESLLLLELNISLLIYSRKPFAKAHLRLDVKLDFWQVKALYKMVSSLSYHFCRSWHSSSYRTSLSLSLRQKWTSAALHSICETLAS